MNKPFTPHEIKNIPTEKFVMSPIELRDYLDFDVKRVYFMTHPKQDSGEHMHYIEKEFFIIIQGKCTAIIDRGNGKEDIAMEGPTTALYVPNFVWHGFKDFSEDAIILALSSTNYIPDRSDYLESYDEYLKIRDEKIKELYE